jgi:hypothetical protein
MRKPQNLSRRVLLASAVPCALPQSSTPPVSEKRFAERVFAALKQDPDLLPRVRNQRGFPPEMNSLRWIQGTWNASAKTYATPSTPEHVGFTTSFLFKTVPANGWIWGLNTREGTGISMPLIGYDLPSKQYVMDFCNYAGCYGVLTSPGPEENRITFEGDVTILNISIHMRQTLTKASTNDSEFEIFNEERLSNGTWVPVDQYHLTRQK